MSCGDLTCPCHTAGPIIVVSPTRPALLWGREHQVATRRLVIVYSADTEHHLRGLARDTPVVQIPAAGPPGGDVHQALLRFDSYRKAVHGAGD